MKGERDGKLLGRFALVYLKYAKRIANQILIGSNSKCLKK